MQIESRQKFSYAATTKGLLLSLGIEILLLWLMSQMPEYFESRWSLILLMAFSGTVTTIILSTEIIREIRDSIFMFAYLMATIVQFVLFFAFQYGLLEHYYTGSYTNISGAPLDYFLQSFMVFVLNPLMQAHGNAAEGLMLIQLFGALTLVLFVLQNMWQFRPATSNKF